MNKRERERHEGGKKEVTRIEQEREERDRNVEKRK